MDLNQVTLPCTDYDASVAFYKALGLTQIVDTKAEELKKAGLAFDTDPEDRRYLWREAYLSDPAGNRICVYHAGENRRFPPWRIAP